MADNGSSFLYLDGVTVGEGAFDTADAFGDDSPDTLVIGSGGFGAEETINFIGFIDEVRVYDEFLCDFPVGHVAIS